MPTIFLAILFVLMIAAPCLIAQKTSQPLESDEDLDREKAVTRGQIRRPAAARPMSLRQIATEAEVEATLAHHRASEAHRAALMATARAASLRAELAAETAAAAERDARDAIRVAEAEVSRNYLRRDHPSLDFPRARTHTRRAA